MTASWHERKKTSRAQFPQLRQGRNPGSERGRIEVSSLQEKTVARANELARLREINADLLAALEASIERLEAGQPVPGSATAQIVKQAREAIARAKEK